MLMHLKLPRLCFTITILLFSVLNVNLAQATEQEAWEALQQGKAVALMRHAYAPNTNETSPINPEKCATERNISAQGANQAKNIAATFRANKISKASIHSSPLCRCVDTGVLFEYGEVNILPILRGYASDLTRGPAQTEALRKWIKESIKQAKEPQILVSHGLNLNDLMGSFVDQGEVLIIGIKDDKLVNLHKLSTSIF